MNYILPFLGVAIAALCASIVLDRIINPWLAKRWANKTLKKIQDGTLKPPQFEEKIIWDAKCFYVRHTNSLKVSAALAWSDVVTVTTFKRDLFTTDRICLFFEKPDKSGIEIHEEMNSWADFASDLPTHLPGCKPFSEWLWNVATPPFKTNAAEISSREVQKPTSKPP